MVAGHLRLAGGALWLYQALSRSSRRKAVASVWTARVVARFEGFADELFGSHAGAYSLVADRRADALNCLYPEGNDKYVKLAVERERKIVGWAVVLDTSLRNNNYFGNMRVGTIADCFAAPEHASAVVAAADEFLSRRGVDLIISNQMHAAWGEALAQAGYLRGPSNFFLYFSQPLADTLCSRQDWQQRVHIDRGDGDGPIHL